MADNSIESSSTATQAGSIDWSTIGRVVIKALLLYVILNGAFAAWQPLDLIGKASLYNLIFPGRARLPYGEVPAEDYNLTLNNLPAMFASHAWNQPKAADEFRVLVIGDSATWGWYLDNEDTVAGHLNKLKIIGEDGRRVVFYNLGYPVMSLTKDLLLLDTALEQSQPDLILWPITMQSFARGRQVDHPLLQENAERVRNLIIRYELGLDPADPRFADRSFWEETLIGRRRELADILRLQAWGLSWAATGHDQAIPAEIPLRKNDFEEDDSWLDIEDPRMLTEDDLAFDVLRAGLARAGNIPVVLVNEPTFISDGVNSDIRYNAFYPRWAYDQYRQMMAESAEAGRWNYLDLWDAIPPEEFTDTPVHLSPEGSRQYANILSNYLFNSEK